ncbi:HET-domain-containing protein [Lophium mytilinum]|uniref:HET-domain-containing protein n=1 Tax=Lophium mytilinum TaxID=390894 RepID=A0A6A6QIC3_9PEZI|nr:HET-domain-containing protein [Lophium mytilinum]
MLKKRFLGLSGDTPESVESNSPSTSSGKQSIPTKTDEKKDAEEDMPAETAYRSPTGTPYIYSPLPREDGRDHIRILELLPGKPLDDIKCRLIQCSLDSCPDYEALSYVWGDAANPLPICVDEGILDVTQNLRSALRHLRRPLETRILWVDAVCIDQTDLDERAREVGIMNKIYQQTIRAVVWLGPHAQWPELAFLTCATLASDDLDSNDSLPKPNTKVDIYQPRKSYETAQTLTDAAKEAVDFLILQPWFERVWVIQEIALPDDACIQCGSRELEWKTFASGIESGLRKGLFQTSMFGFVDADNFHNFRAVASIRERNATRPPAQQLLDLLIQFRTRDATDARDKVFSLLGLVANVEELGLTPDYRASAASLYCKTAISILSRSTCLDFLGLAATSSKSDFGQSLPSWVADWSFTRNIPKPFMLDARGKPRPTSASWNATASIEFPDMGTAVVSGHFVDTIAFVSDPLIDLHDDGNWFKDDEFFAKTAQLENPDYKSLRGIYRMIRNSAGAVKFTLGEIFRVVDQIEVFLRWENLAQVGEKNGSTATPTREDYMAIYWQTLCTGTMPDGYAATENLFYVWYNCLGSVRRLTKMRVNSIRRLFRPLAFISYMISARNLDDKFASELMTYASQRRMAKTKNGYLCLIPVNAAFGDSVALCKGGRVPLVLRKQDSHWRLMGESYIHGLMDGVAFREDACFDISIQ